MILVDRPVWIDHLHCPDDALAGLLDRGVVGTHPMIIGDLASGSIRQRSLVLRLLGGLRSAVVPRHDEVMHFVEQRRLYGRGLSLVDAHLLAAATLSPDTELWTRDRRLHEAAPDLGIAAMVP